MKPVHLLLLLGVCMVWGMHFTVIKLSIGHIPPMFYVGIRMGLVALLLSPFLKWHAGKMLRIAIAGACFGGLNYVFMFNGVKLTTASLAAITMEAYMPIVTVMSVLFLGERIGWRRGFGLFLAFAGIVVIVFSPEDALGTDNILLGVLLVLGGATSEAIGAIFVKKINDVSPVQLLAWFAVVGAVITSMMSMLFETEQLATFTGEAKWIVTGAIAYSVLLASIFGHTSYYWLLQRIDISLVAGVGVLTTVFAIGFGVWLLGDPLTWRFIIGTIITMVGVGIIVIRAGRTQGDPRRAAIESVEDTHGA